MITTPGCIEGEVRLLEGSTALEGRVAICNNDVWGTVCHTGWTTTDARVVCRELGFSVAGENYFTNCYLFTALAGTVKFRHDCNFFSILWSG